MLGPQIREFLTEFEPGTHAVLFYDRQESKHDILFNHLKFGENSQGLAYVCSEETLEEIREEMIRFGLDANTVKGNERLMIANYDDVYIVNGKVDIPDIIGARAVSRSAFSLFSGISRGAPSSRAGLLSQLSPRN